MLLAIDAPARALRLLLKVSALTRSDDTIRLGNRFTTMRTLLAARESMRLRTSQFARFRTFHDALTLVLLPLIKYWRIRHRRYRHT